MNKTLNSILNLFERPAPVISGIYFSKVTGKIFEATEKRGKVTIKYCDGSLWMGGKDRKMNGLMFRLQFEEFKYYELLIPYEAKK